MTAEYTVNAYEKNQIKLYAVLGEADSRTVIFNIVEKSGIVAATSNAVPTNQMLDLTGFNIFLNVIETGAQTEGTVVSAANGKVSFVLPDDFCTNTGEYQCEIVLSQEDEILRVIGITLTVDYPLNEDYDIELIAGTTDGINLTIVDRNGAVYVMTSTDRLIFAAKRNIDDTDYALRFETANDSQDGDGYNIIFYPGLTRNLSGNYVYGIALSNSEGVFPIIKQANLKIDKAVI